jgi:hypothetical protein
LQTLTEIAVEKNSTIIFPLPIDTIKPFIDAVSRGESENGTAPERRSPPTQRLS